MNEAEEHEILLLLTQLKEAENIDIRARAAEQLGRKSLFLDKIVPALITALDDENWLVRVKVAQALGMLGLEALSALDALRKAMKEPRNKAKRGAFYEVVRKIEALAATAKEPQEESTLKVETEKIQIEPSVVEIEKKKIPIHKPEAEKQEEIIEEYLEEAVEETLEEAISEVTDQAIAEEVVESIAEEIADEVIEFIEPSEGGLKSTEKLPESKDTEEIKEKREETPTQEEKEEQKEQVQQEQQFEQQHPEEHSDEKKKMTK